MDRYNKKLVRSDFDRAAANYDNYAGLQKKVAFNIYLGMEDIFNGNKNLKILDLGCGTGYLASWNMWRITQLDLSFEMCKLASRFAPVVNGDMELLPFREECFNVVHSSLALQWVNDREKLFNEIYKVLRNGGRLFAATFGPDSLKELRNAMKSVKNEDHTSTFPHLDKLHHELRKAGFADISIWPERITRYYDDVFDLMKKIKAVGGANKSADRSHILTKRDLEKLEIKYKNSIKVKSIWSDKIHATWEIYYISARRP